ncbi:MAG: c-type cytochrome [Bryobacteraceae bacterium]
MKSLIASVSLVIVGIAAAQQPPTTVKKVPVHPTTSMAGKDLFREYCAVCHGATGKGNGPAAGALKVAPADLTLIAQKNGGKFPEVRVQSIINGEAEGPLAHGSKDMPVWGDLFRHMGHNPDVGSVRVYNLMKYLEEIQVK